MVVLLDHALEIVLEHQRPGRSMLFPASIAHLKFQNGGLGGQVKVWIVDICPIVPAQLLVEGQVGALESRLEVDPLLVVEIADGVIRVALGLVYLPDRRITSYNVCYTKLLRPR